MDDKLEATDDNYGSKGIIEALIRVKSRIGAIAKDAKNQQQKYDYRSIDAIYNHVQPLMSQCGILTIFDVVDREREMVQTAKGGTLVYTLVKVEYRLICQADGSWLYVNVYGEGMDSGDKSTAKAMTAAHKCVLTQILELPYSEVDPDANSPEWAIAHVDRRVPDADVAKIKRAWVRVNPEVGADAPTDGAKRAERHREFCKWAVRVVGGSEAWDVDREWTSDRYNTCFDELDKDGAFLEENTSG